jgi:hypothetical protein
MKTIMKYMQSPGADPGIAVPEAYTIVEAPFKKRIQN